MSNLTQAERKLIWDLIKVQESFESAAEWAFMTNEKMYHDLADGLGEACYSGFQALKAAGFPETAKFLYD